MSYALRKLPSGEWVKLARRLTISLDYDRTYTADPTLWRAFIDSAHAAGHRVVMITRRPDTAADRDEIESHTVNAGLDRIIYAGDQQKADAAKAAGLAVDIWIDDYPAGIPTA
jgi:hypothetical protein